MSIPSVDRRRLLMSCPAPRNTLFVAVEYRTVPYRNNTNLQKSIVQGVGPVYHQGVPLGVTGSRVVSWVSRLSGVRDLYRTVMERSKWIGLGGPVVSYPTYLRRL